MSHPYTTCDDYPDKMRDWLAQANCQFSYDETTDSLTVFVENPERPLTNFEKYHICKYLVMIKHAFKRVKFRNEEE